jgi:hypothetical protein
MGNTSASQQNKNEELKHSHAADNCSKDAVSVDTSNQASPQSASLLQQEQSEPIRLPVASAVTDIIRKLFTSANASDRIARVDRGHSDDRHHVSQYIMAYWGELPYAEKLVQSYLDKMTPPVFPCGWTEELPLPGEATEEFLRRWLVYILDPWRNSFVARNWDQDIVCVLSGKKPVALTENDFMPTDAKQHEFDYFLRYVAGIKCQLRTLVFTFEGDVDDTFVLWYSDAHWDRACFLYMFYKRLLPRPLQFQLDKDFGWVTGIMLGYSFTSLAIHDSQLDADVLKLAINTETFRCFSVKHNDGNSKSPDAFLQRHLRELIPMFSRDELASMYSRFFDSLSPSLSKREKLRFTMLEIQLRKILASIKRNRVFRAFGRDADVDCLLLGEGAIVFA